MEIFSFSEIIRNQKNPKISHDYREELTESLSRYSERPEISEISVPWRGAYEALCIYYLSLFFHPWETEKLVRTLANECFRKNYEGKWLEVQEFLELKISNSSEFETEYFKRHSPEEFFGNFLRRCRNLSWGIRVKDVSKGTSKKPKRKIRHRGYRDKGSLRFSHEYHGIPGNSEKPETRIDRRSQVYHPLLSQLEPAEYFNYSNLRDVPASTSRKEKNSNE